MDGWSSSQKLKCFSGNSSCLATPLKTTPSNVESKGFHLMEIGDSCSEISSWAHCGYESSPFHLLIIVYSKEAKSCKWSTNFGFELCRGNGPFDCTKISNAVSWKATSACKIAAACNGMWHHYLRRVNSASSWSREKIKILTSTKRLALQDTGDGPVPEVLWLESCDDWLVKASFWILFLAQWSENELRVIEILLALGSNLEATNLGDLMLLWVQPGCE